MGQWLGIHLPMQGTQVQSLVWEDSTRPEAIKPTRHSYCACTLEPTLCNREAATMSLHTDREDSPCSQQLEEACAQQPRLSAAQSACVNGAYGSASGIR